MAVIHHLSLDMIKELANLDALYQIMFSLLFGISQSCRLKVATYHHSRTSNSRLEHLHWRLYRNCDLTSVSKHAYIYICSASDRCSARQQFGALQAKNMPIYFGLSLGLSSVRNAIFMWIDGLIHPSHCLLTPL